MRKFDQAAATADEFAAKFAGFENALSPGKALTALKRAASYQRIPLRIVTLIDLLFSWTKPQDWLPGATPVVWPSNALLAEKLGVGVRQVQNILKQAQQLGLIAFRDSPNGHRGGQRDANGNIRWAYGIVLAPIGVRHRELVQIAEAGAARDRELEILYRRLKACRRKVREMVQSVIDSGLPTADANRELALVHMAAAQLKGSRDPALLRSSVEQMEERERKLSEEVRRALAAADAQEEQEISCMDEGGFAHITTTNQTQPANADTGRGSAMSSSRGSVTLRSGEETQVERDLDVHGVTPSFLAEVAPDICADLLHGDRPWGVVVATAERLTTQHRIPAHAWKEACRVMGVRGAAASVIATIQKFRSGDVRKPGAYLRGMSGKAAKGELYLGRTMHGLKDANRGLAARGMETTTTAVAIGALLRSLDGPVQGTLRRHT
ncbi:plasmid replication protein RepC [Sphingomonas sp. R1]|uniref:plasmid replication protein RepC n=1 Tax=Sphingomonas sp. R1 TaxID=399176 RepID=UPI0022241316|nr:plasmid replication protein RepC [Sphingomonas sp. R1]UYY79622.1 plasmid replication protein RepC [Sphingomonas sp. R1]